MHPLTSSCFLLLVLGRLSLLSLPDLLGTGLPSLWSPPFPLHILALIPLLFCQGAALTHLDSLPLYDLVLWTNGSVPSLFGKDGSGVLANCTLCGTEATLSFSAGPVRSSFFATACAILQALCWSHRLVHGNGIPMEIPWEMSHGVGWDGTARIAFPMGNAWDSS